MSQDSQEPESPVRRAPRGPSGASFVPGMVHEIRNFIFAISASLDAFEARMAPGAAERRYADMIRARLDRLGDFMGEVRDYGEPKGLVVQELALPALMAEAALRGLGLAEGRGVFLRCDLPEAAPAMHGDPAALGKAFDALLDLVLQLAEPGATVTLSLEAGEGALQGSLEARPVDLQGMEAARLMEPFLYKLQGCARLGPAIARRTFEAHGGRLGATESPDRGLRLSFSLPT